MRMFQFLLLFLFIFLSWIQTSSAIGSVTRLTLTRSSSSFFFSLLYFCFNLIRTKRKEKKKRKKTTFPKNVTFDFCLWDSAASERSVFSSSPRSSFTFSSSPNRLSVTAKSKQRGGFALLQLAAASANTLGVATHRSLTSCRIKPQPDWFERAGGIFSQQQTSADR